VAIKSSYVLRKEYFLIEDESKKSLSFMSLIFLFLGEFHLEQ
jgi:hypothetical protein